MYVHDEIIMIHTMVVVICNDDDDDDDDHNDLRPRKYSHIGALANYRKYLRKYLR